jgi:hypothetical protein
MHEVWALTQPQEPHFCGVLRGTQSQSGPSHHIWRGSSHKKYSCLKVDFLGWWNGSTGELLPSKSEALGSNLSTALKKKKKRLTIFFDSCSFFRDFTWMTPFVYLFMYYKWSANMLFKSI